MGSWVRAPSGSQAFLVRGHIRFIKMDGGDGVGADPFTWGRGPLR